MYSAIPNGDSMEDFFARVVRRWPPNCEHYHWHVLPDAGLAREHLYSPYRRLTRRPGLAPVHPRFMHVTVQHLGAVAEVPGEDLAKIIELVRERCARIAPFEVTVERAQVWNTGVVCP